MLNWQRSSEFSAMTAKSKDQVQAQIVPYTSFCSRQCLEKFRSAPQKYLDPPKAPEREAR